MGVKWTKEQQKVIELRNRNILVSAAAGSGKTAVLVERIIQMLTDEEHPMDVDRLLIVTFTEAAASEMKERIRSAIETALEVNPGNAHLQRQSTLIHSAQITTIHSFCLSVIREHFHLIDMDPGFRIAEEGELRLLKQDVLSELLEECYVNQEERFMELVEKLGSGKNDKKLEGMILQLYEYSRSYPQPQKWLEHCVNQYAECENYLKQEGTGEEPVFLRRALDWAQKYIEDLVELADQCIRICEEPDGPYMYAPMLEEDRIILDKLAGAADFEELYERLSDIKWKALSRKKDESVDSEKRTQVQDIRKQIKDLIGELGKTYFYETPAELLWKALSRKKDESVDSEKRTQVQDIRKQIKDLIGELGKTYFYETPAELLLDMANAKGTMEILAELVNRFAIMFADQKQRKHLIDYNDMEQFALQILTEEKEGESMEILAELVNRFAIMFADQKQRKHLIDYNDMEQFALQILTEEKEGELIPSQTAREYQEQFYEVMIDEYQDSNLIQEAILTSVSTVSREKYNIFMVGDVKQSIYRFRLSRPELFMEKYDSYSSEDSEMQKIDLHKNFRSRPEVLDGVNYIFRQIMRRDLGGIVYDEQAALYPGAEFEPVIGADGKSAYEMELLLVDAQKTGNEFELSDNNKQLEVRVIAKRIKELLRTAKVTDKASGQLRPAEYRDIVILMRSVKGWADVVSSILAEEGIPAYIGSTEGYFGTYEISVLLDYLQLLDNQRQDLPLAAVLASPFVGLNPQQLAEIRLAAKEGFFYKAAEGLAQRAGEEEEKEEKDSLAYKLRAFYLQLTHFREMVPYTAIHELLQKIIEETGFSLYVAAMPGGERRIANVEMLVEKAAAFEGTSYKGLFNFIRYIEQLQKYDVDYGEANIADEQENTVRIMSIHKSKGLEFPIVFVAGMGKKFNTTDITGSVIIHPEWGVGLDAVRIMSIHKSKGLEFPIVFVAGMGKKFNTTDITGSVIIHPEWGVGLDAVDLQRRTKIPTFLKKTIQQEIKLENLGEELRVLYVALTRAKEKLILVGCPSQKQLKEVSEDGMLCQKAVRRADGEVLPFYTLIGANSYLHWVVPALMGEDAPVHCRIIGRTEMEEEEEIEQRSELLARDVLEHWATGTVYDAKLREHLEVQSQYHYPYAEEQKLKLKFTVSELKKRAYLQEESGETVYEEPEVVPLIPQFLQEEEVLTGASRGSAYHKLLELLNYELSYDENSLTAMMEELQKERKLSDEMVQSIRKADILRFLNSDSGRRMQAAAKRKQLSKEQPFVLGIDAKEIYPDIKGDERILVQGIIDVYFEEDGELVVLDYKTDNVRSAKELRDRYHAQLDYYAQALEQLLQKKVKEKIIYSFTLGEEIII